MHLWIALIALVIVATLLRLVLTLLLWLCTLLTWLLLKVFTRRFGFITLLTISISLTRLTWWTLFAQWLRLDRWIYFKAFKVFSSEIVSQRSTMLGALRFLLPA